MSGTKSAIVARFEALDALRGVCALLVVLFHVPVYHALKDIGSFANLQFCVDMFFALSGFVLCHAYGQRLNDRAETIRFVAMRFARLWPLHIVMLTLFVGLETGKFIFSRADTTFALDSQAFGPGRSLWEVVTNTLFLQSFNLHAGLSWNGPAWSAAVEFYVSILFATVVLLFPRQRYGIFLALCLAVGALLYQVSPDTLFVSADWGILRAMFGFFAGCLAYGLRARSDDQLTAPNLWEACCVVLVIAFAATRPWGPSHYAYPLLAMIVIYIFSYDQGAVSKILRSSILQKLGLWSYSIYMLHTFLFQVTKMGVSFVGQKAHLNLVGWHNDEKLMLLGTPGQAMLPAIILTVLVVPVAALTYRWIEKPAMDAARNLLSPTHVGPTALANPATSSGISAAAIAGRTSWLSTWLLTRSTRGSIETGLGRLRAMSRRGTAGT
ncbi:acyltransferase [Bradyrhizobium sp. 190]|uniref:acyltransferase family protein n=1 Tax=Bradyrhizobium sp. 190 TaxID=2782658 RepID=UPI001FF882D7|nr:acyltransferase [Bradyrhizobium sp. 190]MCK1511364.1 acyltransferase [Bradyrhizobium sp. 190]